MPEELWSQQTPGLFWFSLPSKLQELPNDTRLDTTQGSWHTFEWKLRHACPKAFVGSDLFGATFDGENWTRAVVQPPEPEGPQNEFSGCFSALHQKDR